MSAGQATCFWRVAVFGTPLRSLFDYHPVSTEPGVMESPIGCRVRVPLGRREVVGVVVAVVSEAAVPMSKIKSVLSILDQTPLFGSADRCFLEWASVYYHVSLGEMLSTALPRLLRQGHSFDRVRTLFYALTDHGHQLLQESQLTRAPQQRRALSLLAEAEAPLPWVSLQSQGVTRATLKALCDKQGVVCEERLVVCAEPLAQTAESLTYSLDAAQERVLSTIRATTGFHAYVLAGVTGSGKTEVYLQLMADMIQQEKQSIVLVPEIALTPQMVERFQRRFTPERVVVMHSGLTDKERLRVWAIARMGLVDVVIGTRSAVFVPLPRCGLIVVDEEHDLSFKQQTGCRYSARDLAVKRAHLLGVPVVLGSATPSLESWQQTVKGAYTALFMPERVGGAVMPQVSLVDVRDQELSSGLSDQVIEAIQSHISKGHQVMVFLNRRGLSPVLLCPKCGWQARCQHCDARLTLHRQPSCCRCHYCGAEEIVPPMCGGCRQSSLKPLGEGTERLELYLESVCPGAQVLRIDRDAIAHRDDLQTVFATAHGDADILVGTQLLAKGHHFKRLMLVVVVQADHGLFGIDFRSTERCGQLLMQVMGRCGREAEQGEVLIQTTCPDHPLWDPLLRGDYAYLTDRCLEERREVGWPPFGHLALLQARHRSRAAVFSFLSQAIGILRAAQVSDVDVWGPVARVMERQAGEYHAHILLKSAHRAALHSVLHHLDQWLDTQKSHRIRWQLDIDPQEVV